MQLHVFPHFQPASTDINGEAVKFDGQSLDVINIKNIETMLKGLLVAY